MKPFKDTKLFKILSSNGVDKVLDIAGDAIPGAKILASIKDAIIGNKIPSLSEDDKKLILQEIENELHELDLVLQDVQNARSREVELAKAGKKDWMMSVVVMTGLINYMLIELVSIFYMIPDANQTIFLRFENTSRDIIIGIFCYYIGSSRGSKEKTQQLTQYLQKK